MKKKIPRISGIKTKVRYRDAGGRFATREDSVSEEIWHYREGMVEGKKVMLDLKIEALPFGYGNTHWYRSIQVPTSGAHAGKLSVALQDTIKAIPVSRHDTKIEISMKAKTSRGKIVKRKLSFYHYNSKELNRHLIGGIIRQLFYDYGERPAYPVKIVKWDTKKKRHESRTTTEKRRQLYDVTFNVKTSVETRKQGAMKARKGKRK